MHLFGYKKDIKDKNKLLIDEDSSNIVIRMFDMCINGKSPLQIAYVFENENVETPKEIMTNGKIKAKHWSATVIRRMLQSEVYIGNMVQGKHKKLNYKSKKIILTDKEDWIKVENTHEPIISLNTFNLAQEMINTRKNVRVNKHDFITKGLIYCKECNHKLGVTQDNRKNKNGEKHTTLYVRCQTYSNHPKLKLCTPHISNLLKLEQIIITEIKKICNTYMDEKKLIKIGKEVNNNIQVNTINTQTEICKTEKKIIILNNEIRELYEDKLKKLIEENLFEEVYSNKLKEINLLKEKLIELKKNEKINFRLNDNDIQEVVKKFTSTECITKSLLYSLVDKIEISQDKKIYIYFKYKILNEYN